MTVGRVHQSAPSAGTQLVTLSPGTGESFTLGSAISDTGGNINSVLKTGGGATTVTNASYTGTTTVNGGRLVLKDTTAFAGSDIAVNGGTLELHRTASNWNLASAMSGNGAIEKTGSGDVTLTGTSGSFGGNVTVSGGGFFVNGSFGSASSTISVGSGATFGGSGSTAAAVTVSGILAPGPSIESLATGDLTMNAGSTFAWGVGADHSADLVQVSGLLSLAGVDLGLDAATLDNLGLNSWTTGDRLTLMSYNGSGITSGFNGYNDDAVYTFGGNSWLFNYNDTIAGSNFNPEATGTNFVTMTVVPEPQAALIGGLGMLLLLRRRRKH
jgi:autotransporter-associated beta strand protein